MFQAFYGFTSLPFSRTLATKDLFPTAGQQELGARLAYLVRERGFGLVTGEIGSGKSTAVRTFAASLDFNRYLVVYLTNPTTGITSLYRDLLLQLGVEPPFSTPRLVARIRSALDDLNAHKHRAPVIVLDEAHLLTQPMFEQLRLLFSDKRDSQSLATVVLVGPSELRRTLHLTIHEAFNQRLTARYHLGPLDLQETIGYVKHQAQVAGHKAGTLFTDDALQRIFEYTKGVPRRIHQVCTTALMAGLIDQKSVLDESTVRKASADIDHDGRAASPLLPPRAAGLSTQPVFLCQQSAIYSGLAPPNNSARNTAEGGRVFLTPPQGCRHCAQVIQDPQPTELKRGDATDP
jgi:type II secretory pathway predicted ATPase ExeA